MCQRKDEGGRCFAHHPATKAQINYIHSKTGVDKTQIYAIMKELNKEGKKLENPSQQELEEYFDLEEFKTKYDTTLTEKERTTILKQILTAKAESENTPVKGSMFHAWKNAFQKVVERIKKPLLATGVAGALIFSMSGCAGTNTIPDDPAPTTEPVAVECVDEAFSEVAVGVELIEDEHGTYCKLGVSEEALKYDPSVVDLDSLETVGWTEEDAKIVWEDTMTHVVNDVIDSPYLEQPYTEELGEKLYKENSAHIDSKGWKTTTTEGFVMSDYPTLARDNEPRVIPAYLTLEDISVTDGYPTATVRGILFFQMDEQTAEKFLMKETGKDTVKVEDYLNKSTKGDFYQLQTDFYYNIAYRAGYKPTSDDGFKWSGASWDYENVVVKQP